MKDETANLSTAIESTKGLDTNSRKKMTLFRGEIKGFIDMTGQLELYLTKARLLGELFPAFFCVSNCLEQIYLKK